MRIPEGPVGLVTMAALQVSRARHDAVERACEEALQSGTAGVLVWERMSGETFVGATDLVPYGHIWEVRSPHLDLHLLEARRKQHDAAIREEDTPGG